MHKGIDYRIIDPVAYTSRNRKRIDLSGEWLLSLDPHNEGLAGHRGDIAMGKVMAYKVPGAVQSPPELYKNFSQENGFAHGYRGTVRLERKIEIPWQPSPARRNFLQFGGIAPAAHILLDGDYLGYHCFSMLGFEIDLGSQLAQGIHILTVFVVEQDLSLSGGFRFAGIHWSGIYRNVWLENRAAIFIRSCWSYIHREEWVTALEFSETPDFAVALCFSTQKQQSVKTLRPSSCTAELRTPLSSLPPGFRPWHASDPAHLDIDVSLGDHCDDLRIRTGIRNLTADPDGFREHGKPFFMAGTGGEYYSPSISPLIDREIIDKRLASIKECGFSWYRCHTHVPTQEELQAADEKGVYFCAEVSVVSNFGQVEPFAEGLEQLEHFAYQNRFHPSLALYCLGNEGVQLMVKDEELKRRAVVAYNALRRLVPDAIILSSFGSQGEVPEVPNDAETPHLWSSEFRWGYEGLTRVPWKVLGLRKGVKPTLIHEYGKFGVWPSQEDTRGYLKGSLLPSAAAEAETALRSAEVPVPSSTIIHGSRCLSALSSRVIIEEARRNGADGFSLWTMFRMGNRNGGLAADTGEMLIDRELGPSELCGPLALLFDLGFSRHNAEAGTVFPLTVTVSAFMRHSFPGGELTLFLDGQAVGWTTVPVSRDGRLHEVFTFSIPLPRTDQIRTCEIKAAFVPVGGDEANSAVRREAFWVVPGPGALPDLAVGDFHEPHLQRAFPGVISINDWDSAVRGCSAWGGMDPCAAFSRVPPSILLTDHFGSGFVLARQLRIPVLLIDSGHFPPSLYPDSYPTEEQDVFSIYVPFRAGWDRGNLGTTIQDSRLLRGIPHQSWCDLLWFNTIHGARAIRTLPFLNRIKESCTAETIDLKPIIRVHPKLPVGTDKPNLQDPNAIVIKRSGPTSVFATEDRAYLFVGKGIVATSLKLDTDAFGRYLAHTLIQALFEEGIRKKRGDIDDR